MKPNDPNKWRRLFLYLFAGGSAALIEIAIFWILNEWATLPVELSNILAVVLATAYNFVVNRNVTFSSSSSPGRSLFLYILLFIFNTLFSTIVISAAVSFGASAVTVKLMTMICIVCWNYFLYRRIIFV